MPSAIRVVDRLQDMADVETPVNNQYYVWNSGTSTFEMTAIGAGSGDFLADGTVPMTGPLDLAGTSTTSTDGDTAHDFGRVTIGYDGSNLDRAIFAHRDHATGTNYALTQTEFGVTLLNGASATALRFRINNVDYMTMDSTNLDLLGLAVTSTDADTIFTLGRAVVGYDGTNSDRAMLSHRDMATGTNYALGQTNTGVTLLNGASGTSLRFRIANTERMTMDATNLAILGLAVTSTDGDTIHTFGRATLGYDGASIDTAIFAHRDFASATGYALAQTAAAGTLLNAPTGATISLRINDVEVADIDATTLDVKGLDLISSDSDTAHTLGRASFGYDGTTADVAIFAHRDVATNTGFALSQSNAGATIINSPTGQTTSFSINDTAVATLSATQFDLKATNITSDNADTIFILGRATLGYDGASTDVAIFAHRDSATATGYALAQTATSGTLLNAPTGATISFRANDVEVADLDATTLDLKGLAITSTDGDTAHELGRAKFGYDGATSDVAIFAHRDVATATGFALSQAAAGATIINAPTGQTTSFSINDAVIATLNVDGLGIGVATPDVHLHVEEGNGGSITTETETVAIFEKNADVGIQLNAPDDGSMYIYFSTPTAADKGYFLYDAQFGSAEFALGPTYGYYWGQSSFTSKADNVASCGTDAFEWKDVWSTDTTINSSDLNRKDTVEASVLGLDFINRLTPKRWKWINATNIDGSPKPDNQRRFHYGLVGQDVKQVLDDLAIDTQDFAAYVESSKGLHLRYSEFINPIIKAIQEISDRLDVLEGK